MVLRWKVFKNIEKKSYRIAFCLVQLDAAFASACPYPCVFHVFYVFGSKVRGTKLCILEYACKRAGPACETTEREIRLVMEDRLFC